MLRIGLLWWILELEAILLFDTCRYWLKMECRLVNSLAIISQFGRTPALPPFHLVALPGAAFIIVLHGQSRPPLGGWLAHGFVEICNALLGSLQTTP